MAGGTELAPLTGKSKQILVTAILTTDPGKPYMKITAIQIPIDHSYDICPPKFIPGRVHVIPGPFQIFKVIFKLLPFRVDICSMHLPWDIGAGKHQNYVLLFRPLVNR